MWLIALLLGAVASQVIWQMFVFECLTLNATDTFCWLFCLVADPVGLGYFLLLYLLLVVVVVDGSSSNDQMTLMHSWSANTLNLEPKCPR